MTGSDKASRRNSEPVTIRSPALSTAIAHLQAGRLADAEPLVRHHLNSHADDVAAICILGDLAARAGIYSEATSLFRRAVALAPEFGEAKFNLAKVLAQTTDAAEAVAVLDHLLADEPENLPAHIKRLALLAQLGDYDLARRGYTALLERHSNSPQLWLGYGHLLKTIGDPAASTAAFRRALALDPTLGDAWWALANLKFTNFDQSDIGAIRSLLANAPNDRLAWNLHFTLGRIFEQSRDYAASFEHYALGNRLRRKNLPYDPAETTAEVDRAIALFTRGFFAESSGGVSSPGPIFILGMPRAGSTLVEQILASHPMIEGTSELPIIPMVIHRLLNERWRDRTLSYPDVLTTMQPADFAEIGREYLKAASAHRKTDRPFFIDKLPNNWMNVGFIKLILPNAKIIDARRDAMSCCFSNFKQYFARGQRFAYSLTDLGCYYRDYVRLMTHFDDVLPGAVHRVQHEHLVDDPEHEIRRMLNYLEVPFDPACLRFHENTRPVRTASSEQVRRPISRDAVDQWRRYEPWLDELKQSLGPLASQ